MLELFDTGRMAHKHGKWRGAIAIAYGVAFGIAAPLFDNIVSLASTLGKASQTTSVNDPLLWLAVGLYVVALLLILFGTWQLYKDFEHGDYRDEAEHYKREGW